MTFVEWLIFAATGKILVYTWMIFPMPVRMPYWFEKLHGCDLCSGVWIYSILAVAISGSIFWENNIVMQVATGIVTSYLIHVFFVGVKEKYIPPTII